MDVGDHDALRFRDAYTKAMIADHEVKAASRTGVRAVQASAATVSAARKTRYQNIVGAALLICIAAFTYWFFFHFLD